MLGLEPTVGACRIARQRPSESYSQRLCVYLIIYAYASARMNLWLVVFCLSVLHVSRSYCAVQQRSNVTDVIGSNELDVVQAGAQRSGRCELSGGW